MDCIIPAHNIRTFSSSVACLCRVGKELYLDFDPLEGLTLRALNDAKSAFGSFHFDPSFFERCTAPPPATTKKRRSVQQRRNNDKKKRKKNEKRTSRQRRRIEDENSEEEDSEGVGNEDSEEERDGFCIRVPLRTMHAVLKPRRGFVQSLRIRSSGDDTPQASRHNENHQEEDDDMGGASASILMLCLEFKVQSSHGGAPMRIIHRLGAADCDSVTALAPTDHCSELVATPRVWNRLLDPLAKQRQMGTQEVALTINDAVGVVTLASFHHFDAAAASGPTQGRGANGEQGNQGVLLLRAAAAAAAATAVLKTETSMGCDEFEECTFRKDRKTIQDEDDDERNVHPPPPPAVNEEVSLVFSIKEVKALLQFCTQASTSTPASSSFIAADDNDMAHHHDEDLRVVLSFEWGGRPLILEAEGEGFAASLIMATLDHRLIGGGGATGVGGEG